ncbi:MAG: cupin domain-containing protein [Bacteroidia bacterium]
MKQSLSGIGKKIRELRKARGLTINTLAEEVQVSVGLISQIENGRSLPSLPVFISIVKALGGNSKDAFAYILAEVMDESQTGRYLLLKADSYQPFEKEEAHGFEYQHIFSQHLDVMGLEMVLLTLQPGSQRQKVGSDAWELKYLLSGRLTYEIADQTLEMEAGDTLFFDGRLPHVPVNRSSAPAVMLVLYLFRKD